MAFRLVLALAGATLIASPGDEVTPSAAQEAVKAQERLASAGEVLGAASMCKQITQLRIDAAVRKIDTLVDKAVQENNQRNTAHNIFSKGVAKGKSAIKSGATDCQHAEAEFTELEQVLQQ